MTSTKLCTKCKNRFPVSLETWRKTNVGNFHDEDCLVEYIHGKAVKKREKIERRQAITKRKEFKKKKAISKGLAHWRKATQKVINKYVLIRDKDLPCISCGIQNHEISSRALTGSEWHAGHFKSVGSSPAMRYDLRNIAKQCFSCNLHLSGNIEGYKRGIVARYGQDRLDFLMIDRTARNDTIEHLAKIRKTMNKRIRRAM